LSSLLYRIKVFPKGAETLPSTLSDSIGHQISEKGKIIKITEEPIAFGITALILDILAEEKSGVTDELEELIKASDLVGGIEPIGVSRASTTLK